MEFLSLSITTKFDRRLRWCMKHHYSQPKGFVGRTICYAIYYSNVYYGHIVAGSATKHLAGRPKKENLNCGINNIFFSVHRRKGRYPCRNFVERILEEFETRVLWDWAIKYGDPVLWLETLVEPPRTGECYRRRGWKQIGTTKGFTCKRVAGTGTDSWSGKRVWNTKDLRPKLVFYKEVAP